MMATVYHRTFWTVIWGFWSLSSDWASCTYYVINRPPTHFWNDDDDRPPIFFSLMTWYFSTVTRKAFFSQDHGGCESLSLTRMFPRLLRSTYKYRTPRRRLIVVLLLLVVFVFVVVVFAKSLRSYHHFQLYLWKHPKSNKVASSCGDTTSLFSPSIFQIFIIVGRMT